VGVMKHTFARKLRREQTDAERRLWYVLRGRQFQACKFRRQQPIGPYVVDFACFQSKLVIELDGDQHGSAKGLAYDIARRRRLMQDGFVVVRFPNWQLGKDFEFVLGVIAWHLDTLCRPLTRDPR